jgi:tetratricopeptide (TPR) repeat protein
VNRGAWKAAVAVLALAWLGVGPLGCARSGPGTERETGISIQQGACEPAAGPIVDSVLLAFLSKARSAHHQADLHEQAGDQAAAIRALDGLVNGPRPGGARPLPEAGEVLADTRARLADLRSTRGEFEPALRDVDEGLALALEPTYFRGHLFEVRGLVEERRAKALDEKGDRDAAATARKAAVEAFEQAVTIQDQVISSALGDGGAR